MSMERNFFIKFSGVLFVLSPVLSNYVLLGPLSIGDFSLILSLLMMLPYIKINYFLIFSFLSSLFIIVISLFIFIDNSIIPRSFLRASFFLFIIPLFLSIYDFYYKIIFNLYLKFSYFFSLLLVFQISLYYLLGVNFVMQLPISVYEPDTLNIIDFNTGGFRAAGVFKEPSYFAIFTIPALIYYSSIVNYKKYIMFFIAMLCSTSSLGIAASILSLFIFIYMGWGNKKNILVVFAIFPVFLLSFVLYILNTNNIGILRFFDLAKGGGSIQERFFNMFNVAKYFRFFLDFDFSFKILVLSENWYNSFVYLVANFGLMFLISFILFWKKIGLIASLASIFLLFFTHAFSNSFFTVFLVLFYFLNREFFVKSNLNMGFKSKGI